MFRKTLVARALAVAFGSAAVTMAIVPASFAQSNATGTVYGRVGANSGAVVVIESVDTASKRTVTPDASGRFQATALPPGSYKVQLMNGSTVVSTVVVEALLGQGVEAVFPGVGATQLQAVEVTGRRNNIDVSSTNSTSTFTAKQLASIPIVQDVTSVMLLAPDVVKADARYAGGASIGGGAPSENSYYINGMPVTNALTQLGSIELPFGAISQLSVLTGGFGAEFGRSTGGVVNITTKSGTNTWQGGASVSWEPSSLRGTKRDTFYPVTGQSYNAATDGTIYLKRSAETKTETQYGLYVGGPLIKDKLFMFIAADQTRDNVNFVGQASDSSTLPLGGYTKELDRTNRYLAKIDWNITDDHHLEFTTIGDNYFTDTKNYSYDYATGAHGANVIYTGKFENDPGYTPQVGGQVNMVKYTGNITPDLTVTALYGTTKTPHKEVYSPDLSANPGVEWTSNGRAPGLNYFNTQPLVGLDISSPTAKDTTKSFRLDLEYTLGNHTLRGGFDENKLQSKSAGEIEASGGTDVFRFTGAPTNPITFQGQTFTIAGHGALSDAGYYMRRHVFNDVTDAESDQSAQYIEDRWQTSKTTLVTLGLRNESFKGVNGDGATYLKSDNFLSPRLGAAWDVNGDSSLKVYGNLGRYSVQTPTHLAVRGASRSTLTYQYFTYTGIDPVTGEPTGLTALTTPASPDGETGQAKDPKTVAAQNLKPSYQDELILGFDKALTPKLAGGVKMTYRKLRATLDDWCDSTIFENYAAANNIDTTNWKTDGQCISINPGRTNKILVDYAGTGQNYTTFNVTQADTGLPTPSRTYLAFDFYLEHAFSDSWYGKVTYTLSRNRGNTEGQTKSDIGQTDVSATETWDFSQIMEHSYGNLPSDRTHQIKAYGYYQLTPEWGVGSKMTVSSGRPKNCIGNYGGTNPNGDPGYGSAFFYCSFDGGVTSVPTPRGSQGRLPWDYSIDANVLYQPAFVKGLTLRADVFNLLNKQTVTSINEVHEADFDPSTVSGTYGMPLSYSAPRAVRLTASYEF